MMIQIKLPMRALRCRCDAQSGSSFRDWANRMLSAGVRLAQPWLIAVPQQHRQGFNIEDGGPWRADAVTTDDDERNARSAGRSGHAAAASAR